MLTLEVYRSRPPEPEGKWFVILARNKKGAVHTQKEVTELFEERFQTELAQALKNHERVWNERLAREKTSVENLQIRYNRIAADKDAEAAASARLLQEKKKQWQQHSDEEIALVKKESGKMLDNHMSTIHALQVEVRDKVQKINNLKLDMKIEQEKRDAYTARVANLLETVSERDVEQVHQARQEVKLKQGHLLHSELPWWKRLFRRPDPDLLPYDETSQENKAICRWIYSRVLVDLKSRLRGP